MGSSCCISSEKVKICAVSMYGRKVETKHGCVDLPLTTSDISTLKDSWPIVKKSWLAICAAAFKKWFMMYPELRYIFIHLPQPSELTAEQLLQSHAMALHVKKVEDTVELLLSKVNDLTDFVTTIIEFGIDHYSLGAHPKYATSLGQCLIFGVLTTINCSKDIEYAWDSLFRFIMDCLKYGMRIERQKQGLTYDENLNKLTEKIKERSQLIETQENMDIG